MGSFEQKNKIIEMHLDSSSNATPLRQPSNPQFITPQSHKHEQKHSLYDESQFQNLKFMLSDHKIMEAISLFPPSSFIRELILDHHQIAKIHEIMIGQAGSIAFDNIKYDSKILGIQRETRLRGLHQLKMTKSLNKILVNSISSHLQDIILERFQPLKSSSRNCTQVFIKLYQKLNQIQQKFDLFKNKNLQIPKFLRQKAQQVSEQNRNLQQKLTKAQQNVEKYQHQASEMIIQNNSLKQSIKQLRLSQKSHEEQRLLLQKKFNQQLQLKQQQFKHELLELRNNSKVTESMKVMGKELDASIQDFKNLIYKLSLENKLLKEERDLLLAQLARVYEKFQTVVSFYQSSTPCDKIQMSPMSADDEEHQESHKETISQLKQKLSILQIEINNKNQVIQKIKDELDDLRKEKDTVNNSALDRSMSINSGESNQQKHQGRRYKRTQSGQQAYSKINELQELRKIDKQLIESLKITVEQLTQKIRANPNAFEQMQTAKRIEPHETSNTITSQTQFEQISQQQINQSQIKQISRQAEKLKEKIQQLQMSLQEERQTNASLNAILQDLQSFEKPQQDSSVLTPRMLTEISELKDQIQSLKTKCANLEKSLAVAIAEKAESSKIHEQQVMNLELQCSQAELSIITLQNKIYELEVQLTQKEKQQRKNQIKQEDKHADQSLLKEKQQLQQMLDSKKEELKVLLSINQENKKQIEELNSKLQSCEKMLNFTMAKNKELQKKYKSIVTSKQFRQNYPQQIIHALFYGDILLQRPFEKQFLVDAIQKRTGKAIRRSKMLWKYDSLNKTNLHQYVDNNENFVMLIELEEGYVVGGYSEGKIYPKMVSDKDGFIFSLTKKEIFEPVEPNKRVVSYDDYYVIFGNSELRVRCQECKLFSNFGISSGYFKARGMKVDIMTNSAEREVSFKNMEIHQLEFL